MIDCIVALSPGDVQIKSISPSLAETEGHHVNQGILAGIPTLVPWIIMIAVILSTIVFYRLLKKEASDEEDHHH